MDQKAKGNNLIDFFSQKMLKKYCSNLFADLDSTSSTSLKAFWREAPNFFFFNLSNSNYKLEVQLTHDLKCVQLLPLQSVSFRSCSAN